MDLLTPVGVIILFIAGFVIAHAIGMATAAPVGVIILFAAGFVVADAFGMATAAGE